MDQNEKDRNLEAARKAVADRDERELMEALEADVKKQRCEDPDCLCKKTKCVEIPQEEVEIGEKPDPMAADGLTCNDCIMIRACDNVGTIAPADCKHFERDFRCPEVPTKPSEARLNPEKAKRYNCFEKEDRQFWLDCAKGAMGDPLKFDSHRCRAIWAFDLADAMLAELKKREGR